MFKKLKAQIIHSYVYSSSHAGFQPRSQQKKKTQHTPKYLLFFNFICRRMTSKRATNRRRAIIKMDTKTTQCGVEVLWTSVSAAGEHRPTTKHCRSSISCIQAVSPRPKSWSLDSFVNICFLGRLEIRTINSLFPPAFLG